MDDANIHRPAPRRPGTFSLTPISTATPPPGETDPATPTSHTLDRASSNLAASTDTDKPPHKSRSILNLTASTLFGIYSPTGDDSPKGDTSNLNTPWGTGAQTPRDGHRDLPFTGEKLRERAEEMSGLNTFARKQSLNTPTLKSDPAQPQQQSQQQQQRRRRATHSRSISGSSNIYARRSLLLTISRGALLVVIGICYGGIVTQLHGSRVLPTTVEVRNIDRTSWSYLAFWGACGLALGNLLPWVDRTFIQSTSSSATSTSNSTSISKSTTSTTASTAQKPQSTLPSSLDWPPIVRTIGAFIGICFAIRRLPWQSTLQLSLTLTLANPMIWYLLDRTRSGFLLSTAFALSGASLLISVNPATLPVAVMPPYSSPVRYGSGERGGGGSGSGRENGTLGKGGVNGDVAGEGYESLAVATWTASVLFCSCVCFGNIGRRLFAEGQGEVGGSSGKDGKSK